MERKKKIIRIKEDLRQLRFLSHYITAKITMKENHEKRLEVLKTLSLKDADSEADKVKRMIASCQIDKRIMEANELEQKYISAIEQLDYIDSTIIVEGYINGKPYWKIGRDIGYTAEGIQKRAKKAIENLANIIQF